MPSPCCCPYLHDRPPWQKDQALGVRCGLRLDEHAATLTCWTVACGGRKGWRTGVHGDVSNGRVEWGGAGGLDTLDACMFAVRHVHHRCLERCLLGSPYEGLCCS
jgi:hypothetical protein